MKEWSRRQLAGQGAGSRPGGLPHMQWKFWGVAVKETPWNLAQASAGRGGGLGGMVLCVLSLALNEWS